MDYENFEGKVVKQCPFFEDKIVGSYKCATCQYHIPPAKHVRDLDSFGQQIYRFECRAETEKLKG